MTAITREELDAKIETVEARIEGRLGEIQGAIQSLTATVIDERGERRESQRTSMGTLLGLGATLLVTVVASAIGVYAAISSDQGNLVSAFNAGQTAQPQIQVIPYPVLPAQQAAGMGQSSVEPAIQKPQAQLPVPEAPPKK